VVESLPEESEKEKIEKEEVQKDEIELQKEVLIPQNIYIPELDYENTHERF
jgi:hypothetical protein